MAIKIDQNCTIYKDEKRAVKNAEWRDSSTGEEFVIKSDDFGLLDYNYPPMCENARQRYAKMIASIRPSPVLPLQPLPPQQPSSLIPPNIIPNLGDMEKFVLPGALIGLALVIGYIITVKGGKGKGKWKRKRKK